LLLPWPCCCCGCCWPTTTGCCCWLRPLAPEALCCEGWTKRKRYPIKSCPEGTSTMVFCFFMQNYIFELGRKPFTIIFHNLLPAVGVATNRPGAL
jgi:hypothetical protein